MNLLNRIVCWLVGHRYRVLKEYSPTKRKIDCRRCEQIWAMSDTVGAVVPWDQEIEAGMEYLLELKQEMEDARYEADRAKRHRDYLRGKR